MILAATLLVFLARPEQEASPPPAAVSGKTSEIAASPPTVPGRRTTTGAIRRVQDLTMRPAGPAEVEAFVLSSFRTMDKDGSGFIEQTEAPAAGIGVEEARPAGTPRRPDAKVTWITGPQGQAMWIANMDTNRDGRASEAEYLAWDTKFWRDHVPANWTWRH